MIGETISHFRILDALGKGGMGVVYRAVDINLDREVAIKFLPSDISADPEAKARFIQEAKSASSLDHPNICTIYEIGETEDGRLFLAMALYKGHTLKEVLLKGPLSITDCIAIGRQIASGLEAAHKAGIVHRDIKPANIALTETGEAKILDFGLAKISGGVDVTKSHTTVGTAAYMSPEQVRNEPADYRSDLWSLGVTLYELITGTRPFQGEYDAAVAYSILNQQQEDASVLREGVPAGFDAAVNDTLQKNREDRTLSTAELVRVFRGLESGDDTTIAVPLPAAETLPASAGAAPAGTASAGAAPAEAPPTGAPPAGTALRTIGRTRLVLGFLGLAALAVLAWVFWPGSTTESTREAPGQIETAEVKSIAVLPFTDMSANQENEFFGDGIAEELRIALMGLGGVRVAARASSSFFKGKGASPQTIGDSLSVGLVLEGTFRQVGDRIRITAELTDTETGFGVWSERYDRTKNDVLAVQDELTRAIMSALEIEIGSDSDAVASTAITSDEAEAYRLYLEGKFQWNTRTENGLRTAIELLTESVRLNDSSAPAYAHLSMAYTVLMDWGYAAPGESIAKGLEYAQKAIDLDPNSPEAHAAMGMALEKDLQWDEAETSLDRAIALRKDYAMAVHWKGLLAMYRQRTDEGLALLEEASRLDPLSLIIGINYGWALGEAGDADAGIAELMRIRSLFGDHLGLFLQWSSLLVMKGEFAEAIGLWEPSYESGAREPFLLWQIGTLYARTGLEVKARKVISEMDRINDQSYIPPPMRAAIYAWLGETEKALDYLQRGIDEKSAFVFWMKVIPLPPEFVSNPRYQEMLDVIGL